jgi:hypothetical protein
LIVGTNHSGLPTTVVPGRVTLIQLESVLLVVSSKQKGHAKGTKTTSLGIKLLVVTNKLYQLLHRDRFLVLVGVPARPQTGLIDQNVGIGRQPGNVARGVGAQLVGLFRSLLGGK